MESALGDKGELPLPGKRGLLAGALNTRWMGLVIRYLSPTRTSLATLNTPACTFICAHTGISWLNSSLLPLTPSYLSDLPLPTSVFVHWADPRPRAAPKTRQQQQTESATRQEFPAYRTDEITSGDLVWPHFVYNLSCSWRGPEHMWADGRCSGGQGC